MIIVIDNIEEFKVFFDVIYDVAEIVELQLFPEKMRCSVLDKSHSRFFNVEYNCEFFDIYDITDSNSITVFVADLYKLLKTANKTDTLTLEINDPYLICKFESRNGNTRVFELVLPSEYIESPDIPQIPFDVECNVPIDDLKQSVKDLNTIKTEIYLMTVMKGKLLVSSDTSAFNNYCQEIYVDCDIENSISSRFNIDYIDQMLKFNKVNKLVKIKLGNNLPLLYEIEDFAMGVKIVGLIAPRVEVD